MGDEHHSTPLTLEDWYDRDERGQRRTGRTKRWILNYYLPQRTGIVLQQFPRCRVVSQCGRACFLCRRPLSAWCCQHRKQIAMRDADGTIWYTLDGSDPRLSGAARLRPC